MVGGGISGMTAALEAAECGTQVVLVERNPTLGGRTAMLYRYFPKLCHPTCGLEINLRRLKANRNLRVLTMAEVVGVTGQRGDYRVTVRIRPRYVNERCTACGDCARAVDAEIPNPYNYGLDRIKAAYLPHAMAYPQRYVLDPSIVGTRRRRKGEGRLQVRRDRSFDAGGDDRASRAGAVIWATGWKPYDAAKIQPYGYGRIPERRHQRRVRAPRRSARADRRQARCAPPTAGKRRTSRSSSAPARATRTTCGTARGSAAWRR